VTDEQAQADLERWLKRLPLTSVARAEPVRAHMHSKGGELSDVLILCCWDNNHVLLLCEKGYCTAIYNVFVGRYYADDKYGLVSEERALAMLKANQPDW
jgi:hypothetical protein